MDNSGMIKRIEIRLKELGITKGEFYKGAGITSASYSQWNTGEFNPSKKKILAVAEYLGTTVEYLLTGTGPKEKPTSPEADGELNEEEIKRRLRTLPRETLLDIIAEVTDILKEK